MSSSESLSEANQLRHEAMTAVTRHGSRLLFDLVTLNPIDPVVVSVEAGVDFVSLALRAWSQARRQRAAARQSRDVSTVLGLVADRHLQVAAGRAVPELPAAPPQPAPPDTVDVAWVASRAAAIARTPEAGTDFDN